MKTHTLLAVLLALLSALSASAQVSHQTFTPADLLSRARAETPLRIDGDRLLIPAGTRIALPFRAPQPFRSVGVWYLGDLPLSEDDSRARLTFVTDDGKSIASYPMLEAIDLAPEITGPIGPAGPARLTGLLHDYTESADGVLLSITGPAAIESLSLVWIAVDSVAEPARPVGRLPFPENPRQDDDEVNPAAYPKPRVYSRSEWGADGWVCDPVYCTVTHMAVHHTAGASDYNTTSWSQSAANVRAIQDYHMYTRGWCDIGYNFLIDKFGYIFEGRGGGDDVRGAHDGFNCGSMGVSLMGYFHTPYFHTITPAMMDALCELGAWKCDQRGIDPFGTSWYAGYGGSMSNIYGHRNVSATACPGDLAYADLPEIRQTISDKLAGGGGGDEIILDNPAATFTQDWATATGGSQTFGSDYRWRSTGITPGLAYWRPNIAQAGDYDVYFWWAQGANRNPATTVGVRISGRTHERTVNQQGSGGQWVYVGTWNFPAGRNSFVGVSSEGAGGYVVVADAARLVKR